MEIRRNENILENIKFSAFNKMNFFEACFEYRSPGATPYGQYDDDYYYDDEDEYGDYDDTIMGRYFDDDYGDFGGVGGYFPEPVGTAAQSKPFFDMLRNKKKKKKNEPLLLGDRTTPDCDYGNCILDNDPLFNNKFTNLGRPERMQTLFRYGKRKSKKKKKKKSKGVRKISRVEN